MPNCCKDMERMMNEHFILNETEPWYDSLWQLFEPTDYQLQVQIDYDTGGWIYIRYCPRCGTKLVE